MIYGNQNAINAVAVATTYDTSISSSTEVTLNTATRLIQVTAIAQAIFVAWGVDNAASNNFDVVVPAGESYWLNVPYQSTGALYTAVNFLETAASATLIVAEY